MKFLPIDLRRSQAQVSVEGNAIRLSLSDVHGFGPEQIEIIETELGSAARAVDVIRSAVLS